MIAKAIYNILSTETDITDLCSDRIYPNKAPDGAVLPYVVFHQIDGIPNKNKERQIKILTYRVQVDVYAETFDEAMTLADKINDTLSFKSGTFAGIEIDIITFDNENDAFEADTLVERVSQDFLVRRKK